MEFPFDINQLFSERISILDQNLVASRQSKEKPDLRVKIATVLDELGKASAKAQDLPAPITSASKLQFQKHQLYLMKDGESSRGRGVVVGFLKVGYKKLFLLDRNGVHIEVEPLCVLDFYIAENLQRHGYGLELFNFMLQHQNVEPVLLAYDRPSTKLLAFLAKHYNLRQSVPQVNNFVAFEDFFYKRAVSQLRRVKKPDGEIKPYSLMEREAVRQEQRSLPWPFAAPQSPHHSVSSQCSQSPSAGSSPRRVLPCVTHPAFAGDSREQSPHSPLMDCCRTRRSNSEKGLVARSSLYSRHMGIRHAGLLDRNSGRTPMGDQTCALGWKNEHRAQPGLPAPPGPRSDDVYSLTTTDGTKKHLDSAAESHATSDETKVLDNKQSSSKGNHKLLEKDNTRKQPDWSWAVGGNYSTAQWVKQNQVYRSTRPW
ncbi:alpha-tubulin N-acetyltransferase 1 isoform X1 [Gambusia affinis]|uniref:alpha-tubulin N-acetyltransferase 1 isoform X1 n=1 Tax=Gambusia affinis TaxID=33528 RepID=UPI001CDB6D08|nr:alpha-tubulin N-acetyltransferase 1 isoform X1 [Gambusia affinis]